MLGVCETSGLSPDEEMMMQNDLTGATAVSRPKTVEAIRVRRPRKRPIPVREGAVVRERIAVYREPEAAPRVCFVCGNGPDSGPLEGSGHAGDWVHFECLCRPFDWDAAAATPLPRSV
jgi:hypothetical protein